MFQNLFNLLARPIHTMEAFALQTVVRFKSEDFEGAAEDASKLLYLGATAAAPVAAGVALIAGGVSFLPITAAFMALSSLHYIGMAKKLEKIDGLSMTQKRKSGLYPTLYHRV
jgi:hypothetical protein